MSAVECSPFERLDTTNLPPNSTKHTLTRLRIASFGDEEPEIAISPGELGLARLRLAEPKILGTHGSGYWNGDALHPVFRFDMVPEEGFEVIIDAWGF